MSRTGDRARAGATIFVDARAAGAGDTNRAVCELDGKTMTLAGPDLGNRATGCGRPSWGGCTPCGAAKATVSVPASAIRADGARVTRPDPAAEAASVTTRRRRQSAGAAMRRTTAPRAAVGRHRARI